MIQLTLVLEAWLAMLTAVNPLCVAVPRESLLWGDPGRAIVESPAVPSQKVWIVRAGGTSVMVTSGAEYMMELVRPDPAGACCWRIPVERTTGIAWGTPVLALRKPFIMLPGERLGSRANWGGLTPPQLATARLSIELVYYELPAICLTGITIAQ